MRGKKRAKQFFQKHKNSASKKCGKKDRGEKGRKNVFYIQTNNVTNKRGGKRAKQIFRNTRIVRSKMFGKKSSEKRAKKRFLFSHEYHKKLRGKKGAKQFFQKHKNSASKKCRKKNHLEKVRKNVFYIHTNIVTQKLGEKTRETRFPETHE